MLSAVNIYLDIDGVLLVNNLNPVEHMRRFLEVVKERVCNVYWLTTHRKGDAVTAYKHLELVLEPRTMELPKDIKATSWNTSKTNEVGFSKPFLRLDDDLFYEDEK